jgi:hypothetical protein
MKNNARVLAAIWVLAAMGMAVHAGCGGRVIVDGFQGEGGAGQGPGGNNGQGPGGNNGQGGNTLACGDSPIPSSLTFCGASAAASTGGPTTCETTLCDPPGNSFDALCQATTCVCKINSIVKCTCSLDGPGDFCAGTSPCCPWNH